MMINPMTMISDYIHILILYYLFIIMIQLQSDQ